jgi:isocitrate dehydrogenase (NAD+)
MRDSRELGTGRGRPPDRTEQDGVTTHRVTLIPGDGIGPSVVDAARRAIDAAGVDIEWDVQEAGAGVYEREGDAFPPRVAESARERGAALKGPTATLRRPGFHSVSVALRETLDLYAGIRPCRAYAGVPARAPATDIVIVRMNHEDLYAGIEFPADDPAAGELRDLIARTRGVRLGDDTGISIKPISLHAVRRVARAACTYAVQHGRSKVTIVHKATVLPATDGLFLDASREVAAGFPGLAVDDMLVDTLCAELPAHPERFDVLLTPVMYGDLLSDLAACMVGGLGMAPGANVGDGTAVFEAVHGTAPRHAGRNTANPSALILSAALLLQHLGEPEAADRLERAVGAVILDGRFVTADLRPAGDGGAVGTDRMAEAIVDVLRGTGGRRR